MTNRHHPEPAELKRPTQKQLRYLRVLAQRKRQTFVIPETRAEASASIERLLKAERPTRVERRLDDRCVSGALAGGGYGAGVREDETTTTGHGASARWA